MTGRVYTSIPAGEQAGELPEAVTFELDGTVYTCRELGALELSEIARLQGQDSDSPAAMAFIAEFFEMVLGVGQYRDFRRAVGRFSTRPEVFVEIIQGIFEDMTNRDGGDRPTGPLSDSSIGQRSTEPVLTEGSSSRAMRRYVERGRPDMAVAILRAYREGD